MRGPLRFIVALIVALASAQCASRLQSTVPSATPLVTPRTMKPVELAAPAGRPLVGVAFGGGAARGIAHVGVMKWFEEHRIPIDLAAGTSMGGLVGGCFATGMEASEIESMLEQMDWDQLFDSLSFKYKNIRRKDDARAFPSRLEFGMKRGLVPPASLNNGEEVDLLLRRIAAPYSHLDHFDQLPTPFRVVAVDLLSATDVVLERGSLAQAMRATMSIPFVFPAVTLDGRIFVDGGFMNNVPSDVVRGMGAQRVVAINVGDLTDREAVNYTLLGVTGATIDAMMRANTKASIQAADVIVDVPLKGFGNFDWRRSRELIAAGYAAAETHRRQLLSFALDETAYAAWRRDRQGRRLRSLDVPVTLTSESFAASDARRLQKLLAHHAGRPLDIPALEKDLEQLSGLDRYESVTWRLGRDAAGQTSLIITATPKPNGPPFMMLGLNLENTTSSDFELTATARYLTYDLMTSGTELRVDGTLGSNPAAAIEFHVPLGSSPLFVAASGQYFKDNASNVVDDEVVARYGITNFRGDFDFGINFGARSDLRIGGFMQHIDAHVSVGDPTLPELRGRQTAGHVVWRYDGQDSPVIPSGGLRLTARVHRFFESPDVISSEEQFLVDERATQADITASRFWTVGTRYRLFAAGGAGTSFRYNVLPTNDFLLGSTLSLGAHKRGEIRGDHFYLLSTGVMRQVGRLPDFFGGPVFAGAWVENGDAFGDWSDAKYRTNLSSGVIMDTLLGPVIVAGSAGFDGRWRTYIGVGRIFR